MPNFAIHDGTTVQNVIVADSQEIAEEVTGLQAFPAPEDGVPWIGWTLIDGEWVEPASPSEPEPEPDPEPAPQE